MSGLENIQRLWSPQPKVNCTCACACADHNTEIVDLEHRIMQLEAAMMKRKIQASVIEGRLTVLENRQGISSPVAINKK